jgi:NAD(P)H-dependent flavin oxidoreductase YrpB (nitropropane dioxygenase family)
MKAIKPVLISGREVLPLVDGGRGINTTDGNTAGAWARAGAVGTFSGISADCYDSDGNYMPEIITSKKRVDRQRELIEYAVRGAITQAHIAHEVSGGEGRVHINILWESGGAPEIMERVLEGSKGTINGVVSGAGMPYRLGEIASSYGVYYYPIVSSARAFRALWMRSYKKCPEYLGGVIYEDPWLAGGHNGLSNSEDPSKPEPHYDRVVLLRQTMTKFGLGDTPIIIAGGVWNLSEWEDFIGNPEIGPVAFQFGTRSLLVQESPVVNDWKDILFSLKEGDIKLQTFSPTGFYSSAVQNTFLKRLIEISAGEVAYCNEKTEELSEELIIGSKSYFVSKDGVEKAKAQQEQGFSEVMKTPDNTIVFLTKQEKKDKKEDIAKCSGCLSMCRFSCWSQIHDGNNTGKVPDPRSFCIHKSLMESAHGGNLDNDGLIFSGHKGYRYATDPMYKDGFIPTIAQLVQALVEGR